MGAGNCGFSWSAASVVFSGIYLHFYATYFHPSFSSNRGYGFQLRCLSENGTLGIRMLAGTTPTSNRPPPS
ncbi:hypothetical protein [uncultured Rikenella sp.]|uniref:hypothetical protein n=1 Tax=uncultured Rikenella sp. TaxID=368003 RepID=UPI00272D915E|nr:hypothetical protein [uncultured Rikenella sp.]